MVGGNAKIIKLRKGRGKGTVGNHRAKQSVVVRRVSSTYLVETSKNCKHEKWKKNLRCQGHCQGPKAGSIPRTSGEFRAW